MWVCHLLGLRAQENMLGTVLDVVECEVPMEHAIGVSRRCQESTGLEIIGLVWNFGRWHLSFSHEVPLGRTCEF